MQISEYHIATTQQFSNRYWLYLANSRKLKSSKSKNSKYHISKKFVNTNGGLYCYAGNNPVRYTDPDGRIAQFIVGGITGFVSSAVINAVGQVASGMIHGKSFSESVKNIDVTSVLTSGLGGAATGAITGGLSSVKVVKDAMTMYKTFNGALNVAANITGATISTVADNALHDKPLDENLGLTIGLAATAGVVSGITSTGASKIISSEDGMIKESFVKLTVLDKGKNITTIKQVSADNATKEILISFGQELVGRLIEE